MLTFKKQSFKITLHILEYFFILQKYLKIFIKKHYLKKYIKYFFVFTKYLILKFKVF